MKSKKKLKSQKKKKSQKNLNPKKKKKYQKKKKTKNFQVSKCQNSINVCVRECQCYTMSVSGNVRI